MIIVGDISGENVFAQVGKLRDGSEAGATHVISRYPEGDRSMVGQVLAQPHAFIVQQPAGSTLNPHFHFSQQFQLVVDGSGTLGRHQLSPGFIHYSAAQTGYGPIVAGPKGLSYFTLRQVVEVGAQYLPDEAEKLTPGLTRRQYSGPAFQPFTLAQADRTQEAIAPDGTGLGAWMIDVHGEQSVVQPDEEGGAERFYVVLEGTLRFEDKVLPSLSAIWLSEDEPRPCLIGGADGARLAILQFPRAS